MTLSSTARELKSESFFTFSKTTEMGHFLAVLNIPKTKYLVTLSGKGIMTFWLCEENQFREICSHQTKSKSPTSLFIDDNGDLVVFVDRNGGITLEHWSLSSDIKKVKFKSISKIECDWNTHWYHVRTALLTDGNLVFLAKGDASQLFFLKKGETKSLIFDLRSFFWKMNNLFLLPDNKLLIIGVKKPTKDDFCTDDRIFLLDLKKLLDVGSFSKSMIEREIAFDYLGLKDPDELRSFKLQNGKIAVSCCYDMKHKIFALDPTRLVENSAIELCCYQGFVDNVAQTAEGQLLIMENTYEPEGAYITLSKVTDILLGINKSHAITGSDYRLYQPARSSSAIESKSISECAEFKLKKV